MPPFWREAIEAACARLREEVMRLEIREQAAAIADLRRRLLVLEATLGLEESSDTPTDDRAPIRTLRGPSDRPSALRGV
jgi:hypothetical protein